MSKVDPYECMHQFEMAAELHVDRVDTHALLQMHPMSGLRREYCTCGLFEGSGRRPRGPYACLREVGGDCRAARGQSGHASTTATAKCYQNNSVRFAGSAQIFSQAGCLRAPPMDEVATCTCLHMREVWSGWRAARGQSGHACTMAAAGCCAVSAQHTVQAKCWWALPAQLNASAHKE